MHVRNIFSDGANQVSRETWFWSILLPREEFEESSEKHITLDVEFRETDTTIHIRLYHG